MTALHEVVGCQPGVRGDPGPADRAAVARWAHRVGAGAGVMMAAGAGVNTVLVTVRPDVYRALGAWFVEVSPWSLAPQMRLWSATFAAHPRVWGVVVGVGLEAAVGALALSGDPRRRAAGLAGVSAFHLGLLGMGLWAWALPVLAVVVPATAVTAAATRRASAASCRGREPDAPNPTGGDV
ncbi:hypothetical protein [Cellulomonas sp. ATA003]|uniref:hypothetical protein n=1 Tax=Cellulomonas sp. ATA003 TaxID=3073064 RepID=UPI002873001F|nr:hypothetical protein [Cellulomonas sp. ATA003]WNB86970.1 hypothetical protein REH70_07410 [Cellulomonas sp. ATA003]